MVLLIFGVFVATVVGVALHYYTRPRVPKGLKLPPGPPLKIIIGNTLDMPKREVWKRYREWAKEFGELVFLNAFGTNILIVNSRRMAYELFERRSSVYSDRTDFPMLNDVMDFEWGITFKHYGDVWRKERRLMHMRFHLGVVDQYKPFQLKHTRELLYRLVLNPEAYEAYLRQASGALIMEGTYGIHAKNERDPYLTLAQGGSQAFGEAGIPGTFWVDFFPWLKYVPEWFPGATFQRKGRAWRELGYQLRDKPFEWAKLQMTTGAAEPSYVSALYEAIGSKAPVTLEDEKTIRDTAAVIYGAGAETTIKTMIIFILAMMLHPEVQKKAQEELDRVIGTERLVEYDDQSTLPYVNAVVKEILRWHPLMPLGIAHASTREDIVCGYFIPKGTAVIGNTYELLHNEEDFGPQSDKFIPERFLESGVRDPALTGAFGFGRRICPGLHFAKNNLFIQMASMLQAFEISGPRDDQGNELPIEYEFTADIFSYPKGLKCTIQPRSNAMRKLIMEDTLRAFSARQG